MQILSEIRRPAPPGPGPLRIGFVYDLRDEYRSLGFSDEATAEFDSPETIDGIARALAANGARIERVGRGMALAERLVAGERFDLVFSIAEGLGGRSREAQVPALCEMFDQAYAFSDPLTMAATLDKSVAKRLVRDAGIATAPFAVLADAADVTGWLAVASADGPGGDPFPVFVKPLAEGTGKGCSAASRVTDAQALLAAVEQTVSRYRQPALVERFLAGREFTVGIIGHGDNARVIGVLELTVRDASGSTVYGFQSKQSLGSHFSCRLATDPEARLAGERALAAYRVLGCRDIARLDMLSDAQGSPLFLEANPIPGLKAGFSDLAVLAELAGWPYQQLIGEILAAACARLHLKAGQ
ncbi:MAG: hypothetical protein R3E68_00910 [Burkholderiaceae bacterium]